MKAWKQLHYDRASAFLAALTGRPVTAAESAPLKPTAPAAEPVSPAQIAPPTPPAPEAVETTSPTLNSPAVTHPPLVRILPTERATTVPTEAGVQEEPSTTPVSPAPAVEAAQTAAPEAPMKITPRKSAADRAPKEAGSFFSGLAWAGGEASFEAASEPDAKPGISVGPAPETSTQSPPDRSNPVLAATRSAMVTAEKAATTPPPEPIEATSSNEDEAPPPEASEPAAPVAASTPTSNENAAGFFKNLNWKKN